jgi:hypothetical protein
MVTIKTGTGSHDLRSTRVPIISVLMVMVKNMEHPRIGKKAEVKQVAE